MKKKTANKAFLEKIKTITVGTGLKPGCELEVLGVLVPVPRKLLRRSNLEEMSLSA